MALLSVRKHNKYMSYKNIDFENDCVAWVCHFGNDMRNRYIVDGFFKTAFLIYEAVKDNKKNNIYEDDLVYPFLHSIRHGYELQLKMIMDSIKTFGETYDVTEIDYTNFNECKYSHDLGAIISFIKNNIFIIDERVEGLIGNSLEVAFSRVSDFLPEKDIDPYRYATNREGEENLKDLNQVSLDNAIKDAEDFKNASDYILYCLSNLFDEYALGTHYKKLSRHNLFQIATQLPKYDKWNEQSFNDIRRNIKEKYSISCNTLSQVIKIIQDSRELSYYIGYNRKDFSHEADVLKKCFDFNKDINEKKQDKISFDYNLTVQLPDIQRYGTLCHNFISSLSNEDILIILTYYFMGHELKHSEQFNETFKIAKNIFDPNDIYALKSYFRGKLTSHTFIENVMEGIIRSGDFELFIDLYNYCGDKKLINTSEWKNAYNHLIKFR